MTLIEAACAEAGIECVIQNAEGDKDNMATIADQMIADGVKVLAIVNLDSDSGAAIQEKAAAAGVKNIDYDRLTLGGAADVYVSFDNVAVGTAQGEGIIECLGGAGNVDGKKINVVIQLALEKHEDLPNVPLVMDLPASPEDKAALKLIVSRQTIARPFAAPPGVPAERVAALRTAFDG